MLALVLVSISIYLIYLMQSNEYAEYVPDWILSLGQTGEIQAFVIAVPFVFSVLALRRALYERLARKPGPVEVVSVTSTDNLPVQNVLAEFRWTLATMSLSVPQSVPNAPTTISLLDDVTTAADNSKNAVATTMAFLRAVIRVSHAYQVSVQLRDPDENERPGITVHVLMLPSGGGDVRTFWADDWNTVADMAAHFVGSFVVPRSRLSSLPPWTGWRGLEMPPELFYRSELARRHVRAREYESAASQFHRALKIDPQNPYLRIELAQVLEQLGLWMDALAIYADVVAIESWYDRRLWLRLRKLLGDDTSGTPPSWTARSPRGQAALLIARFRLVSKLAAGDELAAQWELTRRTIGPENSPSGRSQRRRALERRAVATRLRVWLGSYALEYANHFKQSSDIDGYDRDRLRHFFQYIAYCEAVHLVHDYRWANLRRLPGMPVTQTALRVLEVWAPLYLDWATSKLAGAAPQAAWSPAASTIERDLEAVLRWKPPWAREWQEYYNSACVFAVGMRGTGHQSIEGRTMALHAIRHLERAVSRTDSGYVGSYAQWLSTGDQDLTPLRSSRFFVDFLDRYFPNDSVRAPRPEKLFRVIHSLHALRLLERYAALRSDLLQKSATNAAERGKGEFELERERQVRDLVKEFSTEFTDWHTRLMLIEEGERLVDTFKATPFVSAFPQFQDDPQVAKATDEIGDSYSDEHSAIQVFYRNAVNQRNKAWREIIELIPPVREDAATQGMGCRARLLETSELWQRVERAAEQAIN